MVVHPLCPSAGGGNLFPRAYFWCFPWVQYMLALACSSHTLKPRYCSYCFPWVIHAMDPPDPATRPSKPNPTKRTQPNQANPTAATDTLKVTKSVEQNMVVDGFHKKTIFCNIGHVLFPPG